MFQIKENNEELYECVELEAQDEKIKMKIGRRMWTYFCLLNVITIDPLLKHMWTITNNELVRVVKVLVLLSMWSRVRFLTHGYGANSIGRKEPTLCAPQVPRPRLVIANGDGNFVPISW
jgi:hypothetical protein